MRRTVILAILAFPLVAAVVLVLIVARTESAPADSRQVVSPDPAVSSSSGAHANPAASTRSGSQSVAPSSTGMAAAPVRAEPSRTARSARAALLAAKLQHLPKKSQSPAPGTRPARESLPPEEVAAMEARGMDWRRLEQMMRDGIPGEPAAPTESSPPVETSDEEE